MDSRTLFFDPCVASYSCQVDTFFAVGSPLGVFLALRNVRIGIGNACLLPFLSFDPPETKETEKN